MTRTKVAPKGPTLCFVLLDRSGSMGPFKDATLEGLNAYIDTLKHAGMGKAFFTLMQFDTAPHYNPASLFGGDTPSFEYTIKDHVLSLISPLEPHQYVPRGGTPLYDAIGEGIGHMDWLSSCYPGSKVFFAIQTDGQENSSKRFRREVIAEMIRTREEKGWGFVFLGANQDAWANAQSLGMQRGQTISYVGEKGPEIFRNVGVYNAAYAKGETNGVTLDFATRMSAAVPDGILQDSRATPDPVRVAVANALPYTPDSSVDDFLKGLPDGKSKVKKKAPRKSSGITARV